MKHILGGQGRTDRGFNLVEFQDDNAESCTLQASSAIDFEWKHGLKRPGTSKIWLGREGVRMHLNRKQVQALRAHLGAWLRTGSFEIK